MEDNNALQVITDSPIDVYQSVIKRLSDIESTLGLMKKLYEEKEELTLKLKDMIGTGVEVTHGDYVFKVNDNFAEKNVVFRPAAVRRFDLEVDSMMARQIKADKKAKKV